MTDRELVAVRDALNALIALPAAARAAVVSLIAPPSPARGNGLDHDPPTPPVKAKPKGKPSPAEVAAAENALIETIRSNPSAGTSKLAKLTGSGTSTVIERLKRLEKRRVIERSAMAGGQTLRRRRRPQRDGGQSSRPDRRAALAAPCGGARALAPSAQHVRPAGDGKRRWPQIRLRARSDIAFAIFRAISRAEGGPLGASGKPAG